MRYLVTTEETYMPFLTDNFDSKNHFNMAIGMIVYDLFQKKYTTDGKTWRNIEEDHL
jgi:hypothetical protein